jgi:hypothetical protein
VSLVEEVFFGWHFDVVSENKAELDTRRETAAPFCITNIEAHLIQEFLTNFWFFSRIK